MKISFYHWGNQCPVISQIIDMLNNYKEIIDIEIIDFTGNDDLCKRNNIFFTFITVFNDTLRWFRPLDAATIDKFINGYDLFEKPYIRDWSRTIYEGTTQVLTKENIEFISSGCTLNGCKKSCTKKSDFLGAIGQDFFGILHFKDDLVVGGAEYLPSLIVPYNIPKDNNTAFLTCLYHSSEAFDFKSVPLKELEIRLSKFYKYLIAVTDEIGSFPNGDLKFFIDNGYCDLGVICIEKDYCKLHLVKKKIG